MAGQEGLHGRAPVKQRRFHYLHSLIAVDSKPEKVLKVTLSLPCLFWIHVPCDDCVFESDGATTDRD